MTIARSTPVNGARLRAALTDTGLSEREIARRASVGYTTVRTILNHNAISLSAPMADLHRLASVVGLNIVDLLAMTPNDEPDEHPNASTNADEAVAADAVTLAGLLVTEPVMHKPDRLAIALDWTLPRLEAAITALNPRLQEAGLRIHRNTNGLTIRPDTDVTLAAQRLATQRDHEEGLKAPAARILYATYNGSISSKHLPAAQQPHLAALHNRGAITIAARVTGADQRIALTPDAAYAFPDVG